MEIIVNILVLGLFIGCVVYADDEFTTTDSTTVAEKHDIAQAEVDDAINIDVGHYTKQTFDYFNSQYMKGKNEDYNDTCVDEYIRCLMSLTAQTPICAFNDPKDRTNGYFTTVSYCEIYFDNCRRELRVWRIIDRGECRFWYGSLKDNVFHTYRRNNYPLIVQLYKALAIRPGNLKIAASNYDPSKRWPDSTDPNDWRKTQPWYDSARPSGVPYEKRNQSFVVDLLNILASQRGNTKISASKYDLPKPWPDDLLKISAARSGNIEVSTAKYSDASPWEHPPTEHGIKWRLIQAIPINNVANRYTRNNPFIVDLLKVLATQAGNIQISASKYL